MSGRSTTRLFAGVAITALGLAGAGCTKGGAATTAGGGTTVTVELTGAGCEPSPAQVQAGVVTFHVTNKGAARVTEVACPPGVAGPGTAGRAGSAGAAGDHWASALFDS